VFANNTVCGNITGSSNLPRPTSPTSFLGAAGGTNGQVQVNTGGALAGLTNAQLTALINPFSSTLSGATPASGGGTTNFLRADGSFAVPPGTGVTSVTCFGAAITTSGTCTTAATKSDEQTATSTTAVVTPLQQQQHPSAAKAWATITGSTGAALDSYNGATARTGTGVYTLTFTVAFSTTNYSCQVNPMSNTVFLTGQTKTKTASVVTFTVGSVGTTPAATDPTVVDIVCFGAQ